MCDVKKDYESGFIIRDFTLNNVSYYHRFYLDDDSAALFELGQNQPILIFDNRMNVCAVNNNNQNIQIGNFSIRDKYWVYRHTGDPEILKCMPNNVLDVEINDDLVRLKHSSGVESNLDSEVYVSKMYLSYLAKKK